MSCGPRKRIDRREEQHEVKRLVPEHLSDPYRYVDLGGQRRLETLFVHVRERLVQQNERRMHNPINPGMALLNIQIGTLKRMHVSCIGLNIFGSRPSRRKLVDLSLNAGIFLPSANPYDLRLISPNHIFAPDLANAAGASDHYVHAALSVKGWFGSRFLNRDELLGMPLACAINPRVPLRIRRELE
ncbi:hypothetical protein D3C84_833000 [compost metagenome]